jgi:predicted GNAT family acetyltransferase
MSQPIEVTVSDPPVAVADNRPASRYEIRVGGGLAGFAQYQRTARGITFTHTEVDDRFEGQGLGSRLAQAALDDARRDGLVVTPRCPFIAEFIETHPEYRDLVAGSSGTIP